MAVLSASKGIPIKRLFISELISMYRAPFRLMLRSKWHLVNFISQYMGADGWVSMILGISGESGGNGDKAMDRMRGGQCGGRGGQDSCTALG